MPDRLLIIVASLAAAVPAARAQTEVRASAFGFDPSDATAALQAALDSSADTVVVDNVGSDWIVRPLVIRRDNLRIIFEPGVTVLAKPGGFPRTSDCLFTAEARSGLVFFGYGATLAMQKQEYTAGEGRHVISLRSCSNVRIEGLTLRDSGGDGIYVGRLARNPQFYSQDIHIGDVVCDNNRRQGISVISAQNVFIENSLLMNTEGTAPQAGIDFEPNGADERLVNCVVRNTRIQNNAGACIQFSLSRLSPASEPAWILIDGVHCSSAGSSDAVTYSGVPRGAVEVHNSLFENFKGTGVSGSAKPAYDSLVRFVSSTWREIGTYPFYLSGTSTTGAWEYGGVEWRDAVVYHSGSGPFLSTAEHSDSLGCANLKGNLTIFSADPVRMDLGAKAHDISLELAAKGAPAPVSVRIEAGQSSFIVTRISDDISYPLAVCYVTAGTARNRTDYAGLSGLVVIPAGETAADIPVFFFMKGDRSIAVSLAPRPAYTIEGRGTAELRQNAAAALH